MPPGGKSTEAGSDERQERRARCIALEKAYVHDVYDQLAHRLARPRLWPRVQQFLMSLELGSLVADIGCGSGQYLEAGGAGMVGCERSWNLAQAVASRGQETLVCDALALPYRDESLDAALSVAVIHHLASTERRVQALRELSRVLRVGGRVLITVWAMEQAHRKFESQDVLVPYRQPTKSSSEDRASSVEREMTSTTTSEDDLLMYQSYNAPASDSDTATPARSRRKRRNQRGHSLDDSGSDLSSPSESCYSFVRRALQKLSSTSHRSRPYFYSSCRGAWFTETAESKLTSPQTGEPQNQATSAECQREDEDDDGLIELRHLDADLPAAEEAALSRPPSILEDEKTSRVHTKSRSLGDVLSIIPSLLRSRRKKEGSYEFQKRISTASDPREYLQRIVEEKNGIVRSRSTASCFAKFEHLKEDHLLPPMAETQESSDEQTTDQAYVDNINKKVTATVETNQLTTSDIANGNVILSEGQLSSIIKGEFDILRSPPLGLNGCRARDWFKSLHNNTNIEKCLINPSTRATVKGILSSKMSRGSVPDGLEKRKPFRDERPQDKALLKNSYNQRLVEEKKEARVMKVVMTPLTRQDSPLSTYYSMPELHTLCEEPSQPPGDANLETAAKEPVICSIQLSGAGEQKRDSFDSDIFVEEDEVCRSLQRKRLVVKRSMSVGTNNRTSESLQQQRRFSSSSASASMCASPTTPRSRNVSELSEESVVSVIPRKCSSLRSDTSVDSEESIVSVIQRSSSEIEAILQRRELYRAVSSSRRASPLSICLGTQESSSPDFSPTLKNAPKNSPPLLGVFPRQYLEKFSDSEAVVIRDVIGAIVSLAHYADARYVPQWTNLVDSPQQSEAADIAETADTAGNIDDTDSEDTDSYMSNLDLSVAGPDASCCEDEIPQIELDVAELDDPFYVSNDYGQDTETATSSNESSHLQIDSASPNTEHSSSPHYPESVTPSSEGTLEADTDSEPVKSELDNRSAFLKETSQKTSPCSPKTLNLISNELPYGVSSHVTTQYIGCLANSLHESTVTIQPNGSNGEDALCIESACTGKGTEGTESDINKLADRTVKSETIQQCHLDAVTNVAPIRLTCVTKSQLIPSSETILSENTTRAPVQTYWEHFLPTVLSMDSTDDVPASKLVMDTTSEVSSKDNVSVTMSLNNLTPQDSSPDDSLESIEECSEEENPCHPGNTTNVYVSDGQNLETLNPDSSPTSREIQTLLQGIEEHDHGSKRNTEDTDVTTNTGAESEDEHEDKDATSGRSSEGAPFPFNVVIEDYSEESDSCNEPPDEADTGQTVDCLTVEGLANSTSNGSSSTASIQTVIHCQSPTQASNDAEGSTEVVSDRVDQKLNDHHEKVAQRSDEHEVNRVGSTSLSSSQESLQEGGGSLLMLHRYYHVFRESELDNLIDKYVENLHIISSYYDRASWCVIAEKVHVWTI